MNQPQYVAVQLARLTK